MLQFQSLGTLSATSGWLLPGVVGLAPEMGLAEIGLAGTVRLPWCGCGVRSPPRPLTLEAWLWLLFRPRHIL